MNTTLKQLEELETPVYIVITSKDDKEEVLPLDKIRVIRKNDDSVVLSCEGKYFFPKESYTEIKEMLVNGG